MAEKTTTAKEASSVIPRLAWWVFFAAVVLVYFCGLDFPFVGPDEPRYAQVAREMFDRGDLITPTLGGHPWFEKPVLLYWLEMAGYAVFGVREFAARIGPSLCGLGTVLAVYLIACRAHGRQPGLWAALIASSSIGLLVFSHAASFDIVLTFCITAAMAAFFHFATSEKSFKESLSPPMPLQLPLSLVLFYFFVGLGLLAKGLVGLLLPYGIICLYYLLSRSRPGRTVMWSVLWGTVIAAAIASVWYVPMFIRYGFVFFDEFFLQQQFARFTSNKYLHPQPFYFYLWVLPLMTLPWLPLFGGGLWRAVKAVIGRTTDAAAPPLPNSLTLLLPFALAWVIVPLVFFSFSGSKLPGYILPAVPGAMLMAVVFLTRIIEHRRAWGIAVFATASIMMLIALATVFFALPRLAETDSVKELMATADARGFANSRVLMLHTVSHNAEFYAAGRLVRDDAGRQKRLEGVPEVVGQLKADGGRPVLVLVPLKYLDQLTGYSGFRTDVIANNGELALAGVSLSAVPPE